MNWRKPHYKVISGNLTCAYICIPRTQNIYIAQKNFRARCMNWMLMSATFWQARVYAEFGKMPGIVQVKVAAARDLPVMDRSSELTDAFVEVNFWVPAPSSQCTFILNNAHQLELFWFLREFGSFKRYLYTIHRWSLVRPSTGLMSAPKPSIQSGTHLGSSSAWVYPCACSAQMPNPCLDA